MIDENLIQSAIDEAVRRADFADVRYGRSESNTIEIVDGRTRLTSGGFMEGVGIRAKVKGGWGFASSASLKRAEVLDAARRAAKLAAIASRKAEKAFKVVARSYRDKLTPNFKMPFADVSIAEKMEYALSIDKQAHLDPRVVSTRTVYSDSFDEWVVANSLGTFVHFANSYPRITCVVYAKEGSVTQRFYKSIGVTGGYEVFQSEAAQTIGRDAANVAVKVVSAPPAKGGKYDVILDPDMTGVFAHEAFGHASEADGVVAKASVLEGRIGQKLGSALVTLVDDPTLDSYRGTFPYDQEGSKARRREIVENGVLKEYLHNLETAARLGVQTNGAARAMDFLRPPICRMSNTFIAPGDMSEGELLEGIREGVKFFGFQYGYVDPGSGKFMFKAQYGQAIKNGELAGYFRDVSLSGVSLEALKKVDGVGKNFHIAPGTCGKEGQSVPDGSGGPDIRVRGVVVGGVV